MTTENIPEFHDSGLLWFANRALHPFGWRLKSVGPSASFPHSVLLPERFAHADPPMSDDALHRAALLQYLRVRTPRVTDIAELPAADQALVDRVLGYTADPE